MAFKKGTPITYEIKEDGINELIEEKGNTILALREVAWNGRKAHLELRKWIIDENGDKPMKGVSFSSEETPNILVDKMTELGFGNTENIINNIKEREDFDAALESAIGKKKIIKAKNTEVEISEDDFYDPKNILDD